MRTGEVTEEAVETVMAGGVVVLPLEGIGEVQLWHTRGKMYLRVMGERGIVGAGSAQGKGGETISLPDALP